VSDFADIIAFSSQIDYSLRTVRTFVRTNSSCECLFTLTPAI